MTERSSADQKPEPGRKGKPELKTCHARGSTRIEGSHAFQQGGRPVRRLRPTGRFGCRLGSPIQLLRLPPQSCIHQK